MAAEVAPVTRNDYTLFQARITLRSKVQAAKEGGGYIYHSDHSVPVDVSFEQYQRVMDLMLEYGIY